MFGCHWEMSSATGIQWVEGRDAAKHPTIHRQSHMTKNNPANDADKPEAEKPCSRHATPSLQNGLQSVPQTHPTTSTPSSGYSLSTSCWNYISPGQSSRYLHHRACLLPCEQMQLSLRHSLKSVFWAATLQCALRQSLDIQQCAGYGSVPLDPTEYWEDRQEITQ